MPKKPIRKAKSKSSKQPDFYEQMVVAAGQVLPALGEINWSKFAQESLGFTWEMAAFVGTGLRDLGFTLGRGLRRVSFLTGKPVRRSVYLLAASGITALAIAGAMIGTQTYAAYSSDIDNPHALLSRNRQGTTITDRNGEVLYRVDGANNSIPVRFSAVPKHLVQATLAAEDPEFYQHPGVSIKGTARAVWTDLTHGKKAEGGSTLSQQLVKTTLLKPEKSFVRKFKEMILATMLERHYTKDQILEFYFNEVYYGQGSAGIERAAQTYFHKSIGQLTLGEQAMLAGLPLGPNRFDPNFDPGTAKERRDYILSRMADLGYITIAEAKAAKAEPLQAFAQQIDIKAPHFVFYVLSQLRDKYGDELVAHGGLTVRTTLDLKKQQIAEEEVKTQIGLLSYQHVTNAGLVSLDPKTGQVLAMVGSVDFNNQDFGKVNVTLAKLQPGSSFKPFEYATAFKKGYNGATVLMDTPIAIPDGSGQIYKPTNYDGKFRGPVLARRALGNSFNIPALRVIQFAGISDTIDTATDLGISTLGSPDQYGISLALGSAEVRPYDMAQAYATFAELGKRVYAKEILSVSDRVGKDITKNDTVSDKQALDPRIAYMIVNILGDNSARLEEFGPASPLVLPRPSFAKTGTTNDFRDNFTAGSTPDLTTVVWVGNNDHTPMRGVNGITGAAPIWHNYMVRALEGTPANDFARPNGLVNLTVCARDGGLSNPWDKGVNEIFLAEKVPTKRCSSTKPQPKEDRAKEEDGAKEPQKDKPAPAGDGGPAALFP